MCLAGRVLIRGYGLNSLLAPRLFEKILNWCARGNEAFSLTVRTRGGSPVGRGLFARVLIVGVAPHTLGDVTV